MSTHNICFCTEIRKTLNGYPCLSVDMNNHMYPGYYTQILGKFTSKELPASLTCLYLKTLAYIVVEQSNSHILDFLTFQEKEKTL